MAKINIDQYKLKSSDTFFFDTNIWLLLFGTVADFQKGEQRKYSRFFGEIVERDNPIYITSLVISEFSNVLLRRDFNQWIEDNFLSGVKFKKDFVGSEYYKNSVNSIKILLGKILDLPNLMRVGDSLHSIDMDNVLKNFETMDFNDCIYGEICKQNSYKLVSHDKDLEVFIDKIDLITCHA